MHRVQPLSCVYYLQCPSTRKQLMGKRKAPRADAGGSAKRRRSQSQRLAAPAPLYAADAPVLVLGDGGARCVS